MQIKTPAKATRPTATTPPAISSPVTHGLPPALPADRTERNAALLMQCHPVFSRKVAAILQDLEGHGLKPRIQEAWRSLARQRALRRKGTTRLAWGLHCTTTEDGEPESLAVDIVDEASPVRMGTRFALLLASAAKAHGCLSGIAWGLDREERDTVHAAIAAKDWSTALPIGWDPGHVQIEGIGILRNPVVAEKA